MNKILKLFKLQIDEKFDLFKGRSFKKICWSLAKSVGLICGVSLLLYMLLMRFMVLGIVSNIQLVSIVLLFTQIIILIFSLGNIINTLYMNKDNELLMSLPVSPNQIFLSKLLVIYVSEIITCALITLPFLIVFGFVCHFSFWFFLALIPLMFILPLLPICFAALLSIPLLFIIKFFKRHVLWASLIMIVFIAVAIFSYVQFLIAFSEFFNIESKQFETIREINKNVIDFGNRNFLFIGLSKSLINIGYFLWPFIYLGIGAVLFTIAVLIIRPFYFKMAMSYSENDTSRSKTGKFMFRSKFISLLQKEYYTVFRSPGYIFQFFIFPLFMPLIVVLYDNLLLSFATNQTGEFMVGGAHLLILCVLSNLSCVITANAISREGANFYLMKTTPVSYYHQTFAKLAFNAIFIVGAVLITAMLSLFYLPFHVVVCSTLIAIFLALGHMCYCFDIDLKKPVLDWYDAGEISKINKNVTKAIGWGVVLGLVAGMIVISMSAVQLLALPWILLLALSVVFCIHRARILMIRVFYQYDRLEM